MPAWTALALVLVGAFVVRFWQLDERGLYGSDVVYYTNLAELWSEGEHVYSLGGRRAVYRPVVLALFAASIDVFGFEDDSIKKLNAGLDGLNVALVFALTWVLGAGPGRTGPRRLWPAVTAALLYAALPLAIYVCRTELTHTISTFFTLLMVLLAALWQAGTIRWVWSRRALLVGSGLAAAAAALSHEELLFAAAGVALWIALATLRAAPGRWRWRPALLALVLFTLPLTVGVSGMVAHHWEHARLLAVSWWAGEESVESSVESGVERAEFADGEAVEQASSGVMSKVGSQALETARFAWNASLATSSATATLLFLFAALFLLYEIASCWRKREIFAFPWLRALPLFVTGAYLGLFALFFPYLFPRLFLPLAPLVLSFTVVVGWWALAGWRRWMRSGVVASIPAILGVALVVAVLVADLEQFSRRQGFMARDYSATWAPVVWLPVWMPGLLSEAGPEAPSGVSAALAELRETSYRTSWARQIHELMGERVDGQARMLVTSSLMYPHPARRELQVGYYFGDDAVYLFDHGRPLAELIEALDIRYVLYSAHRADRRFLRKVEVRHYLGEGRWSEPRPSTLGQPLGLAKESFRLETEYRALVDFLSARDAEIIHASGSFARGERPSFAWADESFVIYALP